MKKSNKVIPMTRKRVKVKTETKPTNDVQLLQSLKSQIETISDDGARSTLMKSWKDAAITVSKKQLNNL